MTDETITYADLAATVKQMREMKVPPKRILDYIENASTHQLVGVPFCSNCGEVEAFHECGTSFTEGLTTEWKLEPKDA